ncbi:MAG: hypothetical protein IKQ68_09020 [Prevotella sp.]|nr:hypothetical protein [Prevotella sp.]
MNIVSYILLAVVILLALAAMRHLHRGGGKKNCCRDCNGCMAHCNLKEKK